MKINYNLVKETIYLHLFAGLSILATRFLWGEPIILTLVLIILSAISLYIWNSKENIALFIFAGVWGTVAESICILTGAWTYGLPFYIVPIWLPVLWGFAALYLIQMHSILKRALK